MLVGFGYDVHRLVKGRPLVLGGVEIPHDKGLLGHSDADVILHAICDALLGAAGLGDIGQHFPDSDPAYKDMDSREILAKVRDMIQAEGFRPGNLDATLVAEAPRIGPYREQMREAIAGILGMPAARVNIKATTNEEMGFLGRGEGMAALAVAVLFPKTAEEA